MYQSFLFRAAFSTGYEASSAINFAEGLEGDLLIIHGSGETNTHLLGDHGGTGRQAD